MIWLPKILMTGIKYTDILTGSKCTKKTLHHLLVNQYPHKSIKMQRKPMPQCPCLKIYTLEWNSFHQVSKQIQRSCNSLKGHNILCITFLWLYFDFQNYANSWVHQNKLMNNLIWTQPIQTLVFFILSWFFPSGKTFQSH